MDRKEPSALWVLGINGPPVGWHDPSACLVDGTGKVWAMAEEERFTRVKHAPKTPAANAARYCLEQAGLRPDDLDVVAIGWDVPRHLSRMGGEWHFDRARRILERSLGSSFSGHPPELVFVPHHRAHALSSFYASGVEAAAVLVNDGAGDDESISIYEARIGEFPVQRRTWPRSHSLGMLYNAASEAIGLGFFESGKTMGLGAYGRARSLEPWPLMNGEGVDFSPPFAPGPKANFRAIVAAWRKRLERLAPVPVSTPSAALDSDDIAVRIAWSAQATIERLVPALVRHARDLTGIETVCLAGGVTLNCSANGLVDGSVYAPPVAHDAGAALGAAWAVAPPGAPLEPLSPYLGPEVDTPASVPDGWRASELDPAAVAERLLRDQVGAIAHGRAEVGPRALGHRSIVALPRSVEMRDRVNRLKGREPWRPLAPIGTAAADGLFWQGSRELQRYMLGAAQVTDQGRERIAATVHVDGTARAQVANDAGFISGLLAALADGGADPVLINTSFNTRGEPIVNSAEDAIRSARTIGVDFLVVGEMLLERR